MWNSRKSRIAEVIIIVAIGAIVSVVNTLWLREDLLKKIHTIAKKTESNIVHSKVTDIHSRMNS